MSTRERFLMVLANGPLIRSDAVAVFLGEDSEERLAVGIELLASGGAPEMFLSGGIENPPRQRSAAAMSPKLLGKGVAPTAVYEDNEAQNTHEQAENLVAHAVEKDWHRIILVASPYHLPRAFLTVVKSLESAALLHEVHVIPIAASQTRWWRAPAGMDVPRIDLLDFDLAKCVEHPDHVATWQDGLDYLEYWEDEITREPTDDAT